MEKGEGLTPRQKQFLAVVLQEETLTKQFYLTGGTALSYWYLHHRESYDLDFFSDEPLPREFIIHWLTANKRTIGYESLRFDEDWGFQSFFLLYPDKTLLNVDFHHYGVSRLKRGITWKGLAVDSLLDISVNKLQTVMTQPRLRDYVDLYEIIKKTHWAVPRLVMGVEKKFSFKTDRIHLAKNFLKVSEYSDIPKMLIPFDNKVMEKFYEDLAIQLKAKIFK